LELSARQEDRYTSWSLHKADELGPVERKFVDAITQARGRAPKIIYKKLATT
jgi:hypothetical protein